MHKILSLAAAAVLLIIFAPWPKAYTQSAAKLVTQEEKIREEMVRISRELGVTCTECHNVSKFSDDSKRTFKISRDHMKLTQMIREQGFDGKKGPESTCYMCHRGKLKPDFKEPSSAKAR
jgi:hypothetical protein